LSFLLSANSVTLFNNQILIDHILS